VFQSACVWMIVSVCMYAVSSPQIQIGVQQRNHRCKESH